MRVERPTISDGTWVVVGMLIMNVVLYVFVLVAARMLIPAEFGALTALLGILQIGNVLSLGLQATTARRLTMHPDQAPQTIAVAVRVTVGAGTALAVVVAVSTIALTPLLKLEGHSAVLLCGLTLLPLSLTGTASGIAQGSRRWRLLAAIYVANGVGRLIGALVALAIHPSAASAMVGIAVGSVAPVLVAAPLLRPRGHARGGSRSFVVETARGAHALLAFYVLSSTDILIARWLFDEHSSGLYAAGLILSKAALLAPQFVSVLLFPDLARTSDRSAQHRAIAAVTSIGGVAVLTTAALHSIAIALVGGSQYQQIESKLWLFALSGSVLAVVHVLVFDALARHQHRVTWILWIGVAALVTIPFLFDLQLTGLAVAVSSIGAAAAALAWLVRSGEPSAARADGNVERNGQFNR